MLRYIPRWMSSHYCEDKEKLRRDFWNPPGFIHNNMKPIMIIQGFSKVAHASIFAPRDVSSVRSSLFEVWERRKQAHIHPVYSSYYHPKRQLHIQKLRKTGSLCSYGASALISSSQASPSRRWARSCHPQSGIQGFFQGQICRAYGGYNLEKYDERRGLAFK